MDFNGILLTRWGKTYLRAFLSWIVWYTARGSSIQGGGWAICDGKPSIALSRTHRGMVIKFFRKVSLVSHRYIYVILLEEHSKKLFLKDPAEHWATEHFSFSCVSCRVSNPCKIIKFNTGLFRQGFPPLNVMTIKYLVNCYDNQIPGELHNL